MREPTMPIYEPLCDCAAAFRSGHRAHWGLDAPHYIQCTAAPRIQFNVARAIQRGVL